MVEFPAHQVILIRPVKFGFNPETAASNAFQNSGVKDTDDAVVQENALREFSALENILTGLGIDVLIFDDTPAPHTPDSIFPNNWFSTHPDGTLCLIRCWPKIAGLNAAKKLLPHYRKDSTFAERLISPVLKTKKSF